MMKGFRRHTAALVVAVVLAGVVPASAGKIAIEPKLRGGLDRLVRLGFQPDQRLDYLVPGFRRGEFVVYALVDHPGRAGDIAATGARVRWAFRSIDAVSFVAPRDALLRVAAKPWVRALYPVASARADQVPTVVGEITRGDPPRRHPVAVPAGSRSITVDLTVAPPTPPHFDFNATDFLEARLVNPAGRVVAVRPSLAHQISFRYGAPSLEAGDWALEIWYRNANRPTAPLLFAYAGNASVSGEEVPRDPAAPIPSGVCAGAADTARWMSHPNLKRRGVTDIGAPVLWDQGIRGRGVRLAILDTGVDSSHVDLDDQDWEHWGAAGCPPKVIADALFAGAQKIDGQGVVDNGGHGTHVASEAAGTAEGTSDADRARYPGVAPEASVIAGRIAIDVTTLSDDLLAAAEWAVIDQRADVVNLSFGIDVRYGVLTDRYDPQAAGFEALAIDPAWGHPTIAVAAGNSGDYFSTIGSPGTAPHVATIAATVKDWDLALPPGETTEGGRTRSLGRADASGAVHPAITSFSSRGPSQDLLFSPDLSAPGESIVAARTNHTGSTNLNGAKNGYVSFSGTSMATPHAAGASALLVDGYRRHFGAGRPPSWLVIAAMSNTAGTPAPRPDFAGGELTQVTYAEHGAQVQLHTGSGSREDASTPAGSLVEGGGRINLPAALTALTKGVVIHTDGDPSAPEAEDLQPSVQATATPGGSVTRRLAIVPATGHEYAVSLRAAAGVPSVNARPIPDSWWTLPPEVPVLGRTTTDAAIAVPAGTGAGLFTGYLLADVTDTTTGAAWTLRLPVLVVVEIADFDPAGGEGHGTTAEGATRGEFVSSFLTTIVMASVANDWPMFAIDAPAGLDRLDLALAPGISNPGADWDLIVYDARGQAVADTVNGPPTQRPTLSLARPTPGRYRVAVSLTAVLLSSADGPDARGVPFTLSADLVGAATAP